MPMPDRCALFSDYRYRALELFANKGFGQVGMRELSACLGLAPGSIYHHYPSKQHLLLDLIQEFHEELLSVVTRIKQKKYSNRSKKIQQLVQAHLHLHREMPWHFSLAEREVGSLNLQQQRQIHDFRDQYEQHLLALFGLDSSLGDPTVRAAASIIRKSLNTMPGWLTADTLSGQEREDMLQCVLEELIDRLLANLGG
ncbi:TetR/AcrR family transcriptional regulator [Pseudomonas sp. PAMC 29040]|nr:TetR/AcrR family transcriptional regulator [Pseudomonas sp. PAMC 29040]